jgi:hypothetical protein
VLSVPCKDGPSEPGRTSRTLAAVMLITTSFVMTANGHANLAIDRWVKVRYQNVAVSTHPFFRLLVFLEPVLQLLAVQKKRGCGDNLAALTTHLACIAGSVIHAPLVQKNGRYEVSNGGRTEGAIIHAFTGTDGLGGHVDSLLGWALRSRGRNM